MLLGYMFLLFQPLHVTTHQLATIVGGHGLERGLSPHGKVRSGSADLEPSCSAWVRVYASDPFGMSLCASPISFPGRSCYDIAFSPTDECCLAILADLSGLLASIPVPSVGSVHNAVRGYSCEVTGCAMSRGSAWRVMQWRFVAG